MNTVLQDAEQLALVPLLRWLHPHRPGLHALADLEPGVADRELQARIHRR